MKNFLKKQWIVLVAAGTALIVGLIGGVAISNAAGLINSSQSTPHHFQEKRMLDRSVKFDRPDGSAGATQQSSAAQNNSQSSRTSSSATSSSSK